jgi:hypothetical protein
MFGEKVWYKELNAKSDGKSKLEVDWHEGLWLGHSRSSNEILIGTRKGVVRAWAIKKLPYEEQWDPALIKEMKGTPARPNPNKPGSTIPVTITFDAEKDENDEIILRPARVEVQPKAVYVQTWMLESYGFTEGCPGCARKRAGMTIREAHNSQCRERIKEELKQDDKGKETLERADEKWKQWTQREKERGDDKKDDAKPKKTEAQKEKEDHEEARSSNEPQHPGHADQVPVPDGDLTDEAEEADRNDEAPQADDRKKEKKEKKEKKDKRDSKDKRD